MLQNCDVLGSHCGRSSVPRKNPCTAQFRQSDLFLLITRSLARKFGLLSGLWPVFLPSLALALFAFLSLFGLLCLRTPVARALNSSSDGTWAYSRLAVHGSCKIMPVLGLAGARPASAYATGADCASAVIACFCFAAIFVALFAMGHGPCSCAHISLSMRRLGGSSTSGNMRIVKKF